MGCCLGEDANLATAPLAQSLFFRPRERRPPMGDRRRHAMAVEALVPPDAARAILASQQCTQMPQNGAKRPFSPICVHSSVPTSVHNVATVYTNGPKQLQEAILANLCTLLPLGASRARRCPHPGGGRQDWARATGRCHGSHDIDGPMAPVMPRRSDLSPRHRNSDATTYPHELTKPLQMW